MEWASLKGFIGRQSVNRKSGGEPTVLPGATANMRGENSEMRRMVMLEEALRDSPCGSGQAGQGYPRGFFRYELGKRQKRKEMGGRVYGKYREKAVASDEWRISEERAREWGALFGSRLQFRGVPK
jgi:hypothetical protein